MVDLEGSCVCGAVRIKATGQVQGKALCHCLDCRKITGSTFSTNVLMPADGFSVVQGTPKMFITKAASGKDITSFFCGDCGSTLWRESESYAGLRIIKAGTLDGDGILEVEAKPAIELFVKNRVPWVQAVAGTEQHEAA